jgi:hypothetical protein
LAGAATVDQEESRSSVSFMSRLKTAAHRRDGGGQAALAGKTENASASSRSAR